MPSSVVKCLVYLLAVSMAIAIAAAYPPSPAGPLEVGFYKKACPSAEAIVKKTVSKAAKSNTRLEASLLRMHFHDCFVRGCDGSILLDSRPGEPAEKEHPLNNPSLTGFEVIDEAKAKIEAQCPNTVSCADILAFAARDSALESGFMYYSVPAGRRDGKISNASEPTLSLPPSSFNSTQLEESFARKGLSTDEMVTLSGAHSIGNTICSVGVVGRLYSFNATHSQDPSINPNLAKKLRVRCPNKPSAGNRFVPLDFATPHKLDSVYYKNLIHGNGVLISDQALFTDPSTAGFVKYNAFHPDNWAQKFARAMVRMGSIDVLTGRRGEIRKNCRAIN